MSGISPASIDLNRLLAGAPERRETPAEGERLLQPAPLPTKRRTRSPVTAGLIAVSLILLILAAQLGLSIAVSQGAYDMRALENEQRDLSRVERVLSQNVDKLSSPQNLAENAANLGMVQNARPATLRLSDGAVLGSLASPSTEVEANLIPNSTLATMPVVDAAGLLVPRESAAPLADPPVRWEGEIPAPHTH